MSSQKIREPLPREEVVKAVERKSPSRVPLVRAKWWGKGLREQYGERLGELERYPEDTVQLWMSHFNEPDTLGLSWTVGRTAAKDAQVIVDDWAKLDEFIEKMPDPEKDDRFDALAREAEAARAGDRYVLVCWWKHFFEMPWRIRGMQNLMLDYYTEPDNVHKLNEALVDFYCAYLRRAARDLRPDGFLTSDDLGSQEQLMMGPDIFRTMLKPYYRKVGECLRELGMHWWLHSCGNNTDALDDLIDVGLDVFHPVQKGAMDQPATAERFGGRISFLAGIDVQHALQELDPEGVRREVRELIDAFDRPGGGMCIAAGNGIVGGTPFENIEAFLDEAVMYGSEHRRQFAK